VVDRCFLFVKGIYFGKKVDRSAAFVKGAWSRAKEKGIDLSIPIQFR